MNNSNRDSGRVTLIVGGVLVIVASVIAFLGGLNVSIYLDDATPVALWSTVAKTIGAGLLLLGFILVATGRRGRQEILGGSSLAQGALITYGAASALNILAEVLAGGNYAVFVVLADIAQFLAAAAGVVAAAIVWRRGMASSFTRWALVVAAALTVIYTLIAIAPSAGLYAFGSTTYLIQPLSLVALGAAFIYEATFVYSRKPSTLASSSRR